MPPSTSGNRALVAAVALALVIVGSWFVALGPGVEAAPTTGSPSGTTANAAGTGDREATSAKLEREAASAPRDDNTPTAPTPSPTPGVAKPGNTAVTVTGHVFDARGAPIAAATVSLLSQQPSSQFVIGVPPDIEAKTTTDAEGAFHIELPAIGPFTLRAGAVDHPATEYQGAAQSARVDDVRIVLRDGATISGRVVGAPADAGKIAVVARALDTATDSPAHAPVSALIDVSGLIEGLDLPVGSDRVEVAADGAFELRGLDPDRRYHLCAAEQTADTPMPQRCTNAVDVGAGARGVELRWQEPFGLQLRVLDADTGAPIEELDVEAGPVQQMKVLGTSVPVPMLQPLSQHTFPGGQVVIRSLAITPAPGLRFGVHVSAHGHRPWTREDIAPMPAGVMDLGTIQLPMAPIVRVTVTHLGRPVADAAVRLEPVGDAGGDSEPLANSSFSFATTVNSGGEDHAPQFAESHPESHDRNLTTAEGICDLTADFTGRCRVIVESDQYARQSGEVFELPVRGMTQQHMELVRGGIAHVRALDGHGEPLRGVTIKCTGPCNGDTRSQVTDASGLTTFDHLAPGTHTFRIDRPGPEGRLRVRISLNGHARAETSTPVCATFADEQSLDVLLRDPLRGSVRGTIALDNEALDHAEVRLAPPTSGDAQDEAASELGASIEGILGANGGLRTKTDDDGGFRLDDVPSGDYRLVVTSRRLAMPASADVHIAEGENRHDLALRSTIVRGKVFDADGQPLAGATVSAAVDTGNPARIAEAVSAISDFFGGSPQGGVRTADDGSFQLTGVRPSAPLLVRAEAKMHIAQSCRIEALSAGDHREGIELRLTTGGRLRVRAITEGAVTVNASWAGAGVAPGDRGERSAVLKNGRATLDGLAAGRWRLTLDGSDNAKAQERLIDVQAGQTASIEF